TRTNALIAELNTLYPDMQMYSYPQERAVQQGQLKSTERLSVTAITILFIFVVIILGGFLLELSSGQTALYGALRAAGLRRGQAIRMRVQEGLFLVISGFLLGHALFVFLLYFATRFTLRYYVERFADVIPFIPWGLDLLAFVLIALLVCGIYVVIVLRQFSKPIAEQLRYID
ncbi:MAG: ABC transporter permease, partial [Bacillota bacterium]|nr:ABC transporter permease [Bacillota bacterium]